MSPLCVTWRVVPATPPRPHRHCRTCKTVRPFLPSGKTRLNANGSRLDAWLIYHCTTCEATWTLPLLDRVAVDQVPRATLEALHRSDPAFVRAHAFDLTLLRRHASHVDQPSKAQVHKTLTSGHPSGWTTACLTLLADAPTDGLDRLLARDLRLSRTAVLALYASGALLTDSPAALRRPVTGRTTLHLTAAGLPVSLRESITTGLTCHPPPPSPP